MHTLLVGREAELAALRGLLDDAARGRGGLAVIAGEPGIGKSRLADDAAADAESRGFRVGWGRAWAGGAPPYFPWTEALGALGVRAPDASLATAVDSEVARFQLFRATAAELRAASAACPVVVVLDDLHVADVSSLRMLELVARELRTMKAAIVATRRDADAAITRDVEATLARVEREARTSLVLGRLGREDVGRLVRSGAVLVGPELEAEIWRATEGNPLFVGEVLRLLEADPALRASGAGRPAPVPVPVPVPRGAREILRQRLDPLDASVRELLEVAAVAGVESERGVVAAASGASDASVAELVASASRTGILAQAPGAERRIRFGHALYREALYEEIPRGRRAALHGAIASALEELAPPPLGEIAHHAIEAGGGSARLVARTARAALALGAAHADEDAIGLLERALARVPSDPRGAAELSILLGQARMRTGDVAGGRTSCARAADLARAHGDGALFARAVLAHAAETTQGETDATTHRLLEEALERLPEREAALRVRLRARRAASLQPAPDPEAVARAAFDAVTEARALGGDELLLDVLHHAAPAFGEAFFRPEVVDMARDAVRLAERLGDRPKLLRARLRLVFTLMEVGDFASADANVDALEAEACATNQPRHLWPVPLLRAMRALHEGRFGKAEALAEEAGEIGGANPAAKAALVWHRFARLRAEERGPELLALEPQILAFVARWNDAEAYTNLMIAAVRSIAGDLETARVHLARIGLDTTPARVRIAAGVLAATAIRAGDRRWAEALYERMLPDEERWHVFLFSGFAVEATYARYLGGLARLLERPADAERHFQVALARAEAAGAAPERARVLAAREGSRARTVTTSAPASAPAPPAPAPATSAPAATASPGSPTSPAPLAPPRALAVAPDGDTWAITLGAASVRLKQGRGIAYLARLVAEPGREVHVLDMAGAAEGADAGDAGEALDPEARAAYERRLAELDEELREAESWNDGARVTRARSEMELLSAELSRAFGVGGRARRVGSAAERARVAVTRRVREVIRRVAEQSPELGRYLEATIKTGTYCSYRPM